MLYNVTFNNIVVIQVSPSFNSIVKFIYYILDILKTYKASKKIYKIK